MGSTFCQSIRPDNKRIAPSCDGDACRLGFLALDETDGVMRSSLFRSINSDPHYNLFNASFVAGTRCEIRINRRIFFSDLKPGGCSSVVEARLLPCSDPVRSHSIAFLPLKRSKTVCLSAFEVQASQLHRSLLRVHVGLRSLLPPELVPSLLEVADS
ncbi:Uncharacterized protein Rs2_16374 [Raphanus sativus]|nr:Uncharacterized protein Rs2_16374 [Raphanus sativus]